MEATFWRDTQKLEITEGDDEVALVDCSEGTARAALELAVGALADGITIEVWDDPVAWLASRGVKVWG